MRWQCSFVDSKGKRCEAEALSRLHYSGEHPFDHADYCDAHVFDYMKGVQWVQDLLTRDREIRE